LEPEALKTVADWVEEYREFWEERFDRLDAYLQEIQSQQVSDKPTKERENLNA
jgi:hypothetical protein